MNRPMKRFCLAAVFLLSFASCSSAPYQTQKFATASTSRTMEYDYSVVWKGVKEALSDYRLEEADSERGKARTEWAYSTSNDKYLEVIVNSQPRRKYLQTRYKFEVNAKKQIIGVLLEVLTEEEVENLKPDGTSTGWTKVQAADTRRSHELIESIERKIQGGRNL